jgi:2-polyprenyl-6-hydroxyphenyl methylase/3-demethylubiquinone-9 3-methyltransferase
MNYKQPESSNRRFDFGKNWQHFSGKINELRIQEAMKSLTSMLDDVSLQGKLFMDVGCGSGLFSLAARRLGAQVHSFDFDPDSVACTKHLKNRFFQNDTSWHIEQGDILNGAYIQSMGQFDAVYSWGVLHHTGNMYKALHNVDMLVKRGGFLYLAIYNDSGRVSRRWLRIKKLYNDSPHIIRLLLVTVIAFLLEAKRALGKWLRLENPLPCNDWKNKKKQRGMSVWHDYVDLVGGYPFEFATPEQIFSFYKKKGYMLSQLKTCGGGYGCNEYVLKKLG